MTTGFAEVLGGRESDSGCCIKATDDAIEGAGRVGVERDSLGMREQEDDDGVGGVMRPAKNTTRRTSRTSGKPI